MTLAAVGGGIHWRWSCAAVIPRRANLCGTDNAVRVMQSRCHRTQVVRPVQISSIS
ncbi:hypothetical protein RSSM_00972 [Rhodopirellula sallentina SM41]|uniref:Uncharacterized protein n=1 Tax=Rhodopirellula sallentina SM41 TaxID=1263870 RepID=M5UIE8_9BACT|nr:hypothetical protein RSSM_00972 [Rhodopirellula sallentina SM41]